MKKSKSQKKWPWFFDCQKNFKLELYCVLGGTQSTSLDKVGACTYVHVLTWSFSSCSSASMRKKSLCVIFLMALSSTGRKKNNRFFPCLAVTPLLVSNIHIFMPCGNEIHSYHLPIVYCPPNITFIPFFATFLQHF